MIDLKIKIAKEIIILTGDNKMENFRKKCELLKKINGGEVGKDTIRDLVIERAIVLADLTCLESNNK